MSSAAIGTLTVFGSSAVPALPGATKIALTRGAAATFQANACSRPPPPMISTFMPRGPSSMAEMTHAGEHHGEPTLVCRGDHFIVLLRATGLNDGRDALPGRDIDAVAEWEEGIGCRNGAFDLEPRIDGFHCRDAARDHAAHLACAYADCHIVACKNDGI